MRPTTLDQIIGQQAVVGPGAPLRAALRQGQLYSLVLFGPPGVGKTTIARAIAHEVAAEFIQLSAVTAGIKDLREVIAQAAKNHANGDMTVLFVDEIHRWNKSQQDALLPHVEDGTIILIGATTENPGFEINRALMSRLKLEVLQPLSDDEQRQLIARAFTEPSALGGRTTPLTLSAEAESLLLVNSGGDGRSLLTALERAAAELPTGGVIEREAIEQALGQRRFAFDRAGDLHYDLVSALIKSVRGSDPDAALYYLARLERGGEDPKFVARRLVVQASEDIGMAAPGALAVASAGFDAVIQVGPPECWINLAHIVCYLATSPKSWTSYEGWRRAQAVVDQQPEYPVPVALRNAPTAIARQLGHGQGYTHAAKPGAETMKFLPPELQSTQIYQPSGTERHAGWSRAR